MKIIKFSDGERYPMLLSAENGIPSFMATNYITSMRRSANRAAKTLESELRAIMQLYTWALLESIDVESRFEQGQFLEVHEIDAVVRAAGIQYDELVKLYEFKGCEKLIGNVSSYERFRNTAKAKSNQVSGATKATRIRNIRDYLNWLAHKAMARAYAQQGGLESLNIAKELMVKAFTARLPKGGARNSEQSRVGINQEVVDRILHTLNPDSPDNPFADKGTRIRNQLIFILMLTQGIRRGEALGIKIDDINFQNDTLLIRRRADDPEDVRKDQPNAKTRDRKLPLDAPTSELLREYIINVRTEVLGANRHKFLFVTHKSGPHAGKPLSTVGFSKIFQTLRERAPGIPNNLTGHVLRHTWNERFSEFLDERGATEEREQKLRSYLMGWSEMSGSAATYTKRHIQKKAHEASLNLQKQLIRKFDNDE